MNSDSTAVVEMAPNHSNPSQTKKIGVLVVDDQELIRTLLKTTLEGAGFKVWLASDGWKALEVFRCHFREIQVVLLDINIPGLDGPFTWDTLRSINPMLRCCFMTGDTGSYNHQALYDRGASLVLEKPLKLADVARQLRLLGAQ